MKNKLMPNLITKGRVNKQNKPKDAQITSTNKMCECGCDNEAQVMHKDLYTGTETYLCKNCEIDYVMNSLTTEQFFALIKKGHTTEEFMLHSDFYDEETGEAIQPKISR